MPWPMRNVSSIYRVERVFWKVEMGEFGESSGPGHWWLVNLVVETVDGW